MKTAILVAFLTSAIAPTAYAQDQIRDALLGRIVVSYARVNMVSPNSPLVDAFLNQAKVFNSGVTPEVWDSVRPDIAAAISDAVTTRGGILDVYLRAGTKEMTNEELVRLQAIMEDPAFRKFQIAIGSSAAQAQLMQSLMSGGLQLSATVNSVLVKHGLNGGH